MTQLNNAENVEPVIGDGLATGSAPETTEALAGSAAAERMRHRERIVACVLGALLLATLVTSHAVSGVFARYATGAASTDTARVAFFGHNETIDLGNWTADLKPGDARTITLEVSNANSAGTVGEVAQGYDITLETAGNLPLTFELKDGAGKVVDTFNESSSEPAHTFTSSDMVFEAGGTADAHTYTITVSWPADADSGNYADIPDYVQASINTRQID